MMDKRRRQLRLHKMRYLLDQLNDDDFGVEICLQHLSGQALLRARRPHLVIAGRQVLRDRRSPGRKQHYVDDRRRPTLVTRARLALRATLVSGLIFPVLLLLIR